MFVLQFCLQNSPANGFFTHWELFYNLIGKRTAGKDLEKKKNCNLLVAEKCRPWQAGISLACTSRPEPTACAAARAKSDSARFLASYARPHARHMLCRICRWPPGMTTTISLHLCNLFTKKWGVFLTNFLN